MKQIEKLELILRTLYKFRANGGSTMEEICETQNIPLNSRDEIQSLAEWLKDKNYIKLKLTKGSTFVTINSHGIEYCEEDLGLLKNNSLINNIFNINNISNCPNTNIVLDSSNVTFTIQNYPEIENKIKDIEQAILDSHEIHDAERENLKECLNDIKTSLESGKKPKCSFQVLLSNVANIGTIGQLVLQLGELISFN